MAYSEFVDLGYKPTDDELICLFRVEPAAGFSMKEAAGRIASESSNGTWADLTTMNARIRRLSAKAYKFSGNYVWVAYPPDLFEFGNMPQIFSSIAGNIFGMKAIKNLRLEDVRWPKSIIKSFMGPQFGVDGVRKIFKVYDRPLTATVPKPKVGMTAKEHAHVLYEAWSGGLDLGKDDENLSSQKFNRFEDRVIESLKMRDKAERETGDRKSYLINITAETREMVRRARFIKQNGGEYAMVDILTAGWAGLQTVREECRDLKLAIHAHRAFHASFTRNRRHGMSMLVVAEAAKMVGVDQLHIGTVVGKLVSPREEVSALHSTLEKGSVRNQPLALEQDWFGAKPVLSVCSGGLHAGLLPKLIKMLGKDIVIQVGGGVWGHKDGGKAGAKAIRQAIDASMEGIELGEYAKTHRELADALGMWGTATFK